MDLRLTGRGRLVFSSASATGSNFEVGQNACLAQDFYMDKVVHGVSKEGLWYWRDVPLDTVICSYEINAGCQKSETVGDQ